MKDQFKIDKFLITIKEVPDSSVTEFADGNMFRLTITCGRTKLQGENFETKQECFRQALIFLDKYL